MAASEWHKLDTGALKRRTKYTKIKTAVQRMERYRVDPLDASRMVQTVEHFVNTVHLPPTGYDMYAICRAVEESLIRRALRDFGGDPTLAAQFMAINRTTLYEKCKKLGICIDTYREIKQQRAAGFAPPHEPETATRLEP